MGSSLPIRPGRSPGSVPGEARGWIVQRPAEELPPDLRHSKGWLEAAILSLLLAGVLSLVVVLGRVPRLGHIIPDPMFYKRSLVVHVNLALTAWMLSFLAALYYLVASRSRDPGRWIVWALPWRSVPAEGRESPGLAPWAIAAAKCSILLLACCMFLPHARPLMTNYVPVIDHPLFMAGLLLLAGSVLATLLDGRLLSGPGAPQEGAQDHAAARYGLRAAMISCLLAAATFAVAAAVEPGGAEPEARYGRIFWGGGHVLQFAHAAGMMTAWSILLTKVLGRPPIRKEAAAAIFGLLVLPILCAPFLPLWGAASSVPYNGFTNLMRYGIAPPVILMLSLCCHALLRGAREGVLGRSALRDPCLTGFAASSALTLLGFILGASIRNSTTLIPAHYHSSIGGVTVAYMATAYALLERFGMDAQGSRLKPLAAWQPVVYGAGQVVFALGFGFAGLHGAARKVYGHEQVVQTSAESAGLVVMSLGGVMAVAGGLIFLAIVLGAWRSKAPAPGLSPAGPSGANKGKGDIHGKRAQMHRAEVHG